MERHERRLADAEREQAEHHRGHPFRHPGQDAAGAEVHGAGVRPGPHDGEKLEPDGGPEQGAEVDPSRPPRLGGAGVGHERVGGQRQRLVEDEQGDEVVRERDPHGGPDGDREAGVEPRLVLLVMRPHVADGVDRGDEPQEPRHHREQHPERLDHQLERDPGHQRRENQARPPALSHLGVDPEHAREDQRRGHQGDSLPQIRCPERKNDQPDRQQRQRKTSESPGPKGSPGDSRTEPRGYRARRDIGRPCGDADACTRPSRERGRPARCGPQAHVRSSGRDARAPGGRGRRNDHASPIVTHGPGSARHRRRAGGAITAATPEAPHPPSPRTRR